jgi:hypothetical protein
MAIFEEGRECAKCGRLVDQSEDGVYLNLFQEKEGELEASPEGEFPLDFVYRCPACRGEES